MTVDAEISWRQLEKMMLAMRTVEGQSAFWGLVGVPLGDLYALANAIAAIVGGAVALEDPHGRVYAYSTLANQPIDDVRRNTILRRQAEDTTENRLRYRRLFQTEGVLHSLDHQDEEPRLVIAVRAGEEILGSISVMWTRDPPDKEVQEAMAEAARIAALHIVQSRASLDAERRVRSNTMRALLGGKGSVSSSAHRLGLDPKGRLVILAFAISSGDQAQEYLHLERLVDFISLYCEVHRLRAACALVGRTVYALVNFSADSSMKRWMSTARQILDQGESRLGSSLRVAVGSAACPLLDLPRSRREVDRVLRVLSSGRQDQMIASFEDVGDQATLLAIEELAREQPEFTQGALGEIIAYDAEHGTSFIETLRAHFETFGDVGKTSELLGLHPNTVRYRLGRCSKLFKLDLDDYDSRLVAEIQIRLLSFPSIKGLSHWATTKYGDKDE